MQPYRWWISQYKCTIIGGMCQAFDDYEYFLKNVGKNICKARKDMKLSQEALAFSINSARNYVGCIERAEKSASLRMLHKISKVLNVKVEDLVHSL